MATHLGWWAHVCVLIVCGILVVVTDHTSQGIPALQRPTPTAKLPYRPSTPMFPYRKSFRAWAKKHEDLLVEGPSGDGPIDHWQTPEVKSTLTTSVGPEYKARSPTPEEVFQSLFQPFPTIVDTAVDSSEEFLDEILSRSSVSFEGPSSLLNTFIFRPSVSGEFGVTPSIGMSSVTVEEESYDLMASWTDLMKVESSFTMSSRRAISDVPSDVYAIITAISATHIYMDDYLTTYSPSSALDDSFGHLITYSSMERVPDLISTSQLSDVPNFTTNISVHLQTFYDTKQQNFSDQSQTIRKTIISSSPSSIQPPISDNFIDSALLSDGSLVVPYSEYPATFVTATFLHWSPTFSFTSSISNENILSSDTSLDNSFSDSIVLLSPSIPILTSYNTFLLNTVETTVTIIDSKRTLNTFIRPTFTVSGSSFKKTPDHLSNILQGFTLSSFNKELEYETFSSYNHISLGLDTESLSFLKRAENDTFFTTEILADTSSVLTTSSHPIKSTVVSSDKLSESSKTFTFNETGSQHLSTELNKTITEFDKISIESSKHKLSQSQMPELQTKTSTTYFSIPSPEFSDKIKYFTDIFPSVMTSFNIQDGLSETSFSWKPTDFISNEIVYSTHEWGNDMFSSKQSLKSEITSGVSTQDFTNISKTFSNTSLQKDEYFETSTHHVTYRSLKETLDFETSEYASTEEPYTNVVDSFEESFLSSNRKVHFPSSSEYRIALNSSLELNVEEEKEILPSTSLISAETFQTVAKPISKDSEESIKKGSVSTLEYSWLDEKDVTGLKSAFSLTSYYGEIFPSMSSVRLSSGVHTDSLWNDTYSQYILEKSSSEAHETQFVDISTNKDYNTHIPELTSTSITPTNYPITPTNVLDEFSQDLSSFDNYFLESSNLSSKSLEEDTPIKSPFLNSSRKGSYDESIEHNTLGSENLDSSFGAFTMETEISPTLSSSMQSFEITSPKKVLLNLTAEKTYRVSLGLLDNSTVASELGGMIHSSSDKNHDGKIYETYISNEDVSSDFFVLLTPSITFDFVSSSFPFNTLDSKVFSDFVPHSTYSVPQILPHSVIIKSHSEISEKEFVDQSTLKKSTSSLLLRELTSPTVYTHKDINQSILTSFDFISIIPGNKETSYFKIDALDLSVFTEALTPTPTFYISQTEYLQSENSLMTKQLRSLDLYHSLYEFSNEFELPSVISSLDTNQHTFLTNEMPKPSVTIDYNSNFSTFLLSNFTEKVMESSSNDALVSESSFTVSHVYTKYQLSLESDHLEHNTPLTSGIVSSKLSKPTEILSTGHDHFIIELSSSFQTVSSSYTKVVEPLSIESDHQISKTSKSFQIVSTIHTKAIEPHSIESDYPKHRISSSSQSASRSHTKTIDPLSIESDHHVPSVSKSSTRKMDPPSIESDHHNPKISSSYQTVSQVLIKAIEPLSIESDHHIPRISSSIHPVSHNLTKAIEPQSIETDRLIPKISISFHTAIPSHSKVTEPKSIESDHPRPKATIPSQTPFLTHHTTFLSVKPQFESTSTSSHSLRFPTSAITSTLKTYSQMFSSADLRPTWTNVDTATPDDSALIPVSSYFNVNHTSGGAGGQTNEKNQVDGNSSTSGEDTTPSDRTTLFKDSHYWVLTVLESPVKGQLPENFTHTMEIRLANAYSEAFRIRAASNDTKGGQDMILVKILSFADNILLRQLELVYVVERGGQLVPANVAAEYLNSLRFEQLREFLGYHVIVKARPYQPRPDPKQARDVVPVLAIVGGVLGSLLVLLCCCCVWCRCCRPKTVPTTPDSSTSGSLQRSLSKYGQHNRKHLFREMTHQLTTEMAAQMKHGSSAADAYLADKARSLPTLPRDERRTDEQSMKILKILENKDASTSPVAGRSTREETQENDTSSLEKTKKSPKPKRRRKIKDSQEQRAKGSKSVHPLENVQPESPPPTPPPKRDVSIPTSDSRQSYNSETSSRLVSTQPSSPSEKSAGSEGSQIGLLPTTRDLSDNRDVESPAAVETQQHLSRVRQRIGELLDDAFALAGGRKLYGSLRSKKIEPTADSLSRFGSFRSRSAVAGEYTLTHPRGGIIERRPVTEGGQRLLGVITDEGQLITHPVPKPVWDHEEEESIPSPDTHEVVEAHNFNLFPLQSPKTQPTLSTIPQPVDYPYSAANQLLREAQGPSPATAESLLRESENPAQPRGQSSTAAELLLRESELRVAARVNSAVADDYDEIDVVGSLRSNGEPVEALVRAIKEELQRFSGSLPGANNGESHA
ncbi:hypothetical protein JTE90_027668 [Oedothorax gibbosus]|uniref:Uncharacterized protein n=1 Tax=Oedothorax gibbosus TaxID=931172 RepID=A0AAV6UQK2_9ARAC|nr:hypothetical protein JTE90_027668 [Oedothorax gibbosus]